MPLEKLAYQLAVRTTIHVVASASALMGTIQFGLGALAGALVGAFNDGTPAAMVLVIMPWGLGCFAANSAQQARLGHAAPALAPALMALNTSAIYLGQAAGAAGGGALLTAQGYAALAPVGVVWMVASLALSVWAGRRAAKAAHAA